MHQLLSLRTKISIIVGFAAVISGLTSWAGLHPVSIAVLVGVIEATIVWLLLNSWDWIAAIPLVPRPLWMKVDLNGKWTGTISSSYGTGGGSGTQAVIPTKLTIRQTWQEVVFSLETTEMRSRSLDAIPTYDAVTRELRFRYFFETEPLASAVLSNPPQQLACANARINLTAPDRLTIRYTNERGLGGEISLRRQAEQRRRLAPRL